MSVTAKTETNKKFSFYPMHCIIVVALMFGLGYIPAPAPLTADGMKTLGILFGLIYGWMTAGLIWPSLLGVLAYAINGLMPINQVYAQSFGSNLFWLIAFLLILSAMIDSANLTKVIAMWFITKRSLYGKPWVFSFVFLFATFILSATTHVMAAIVICWGILYRICQKLNYQKREPYPAYMVLGIVLAGTLGTALLPFKPLPYAILSTFTNMYQEVVTFGQYVAFSAVICLITLVAFVAIGKFVLRIDVTSLKNLDDSVFEPEDFDHHLNKEQKTAMGVLVAMIFLLLVPSMLPASVPILGFFKQLGVAGTVIFLTLCLVAFRVDGKPILSFGAMANAGLQWPTLLLVAAINPIGNLIPAESTGIQPFLMTNLVPLFQGKSEIVFLVIMVFLAIIMTNFFNNAVTGVLLIAATTPITISMGLNASVFALIITYSIHLALVTPAGSTMSAILFDNLEWISQKQIMQYAIPNLILMGVLIIVVGYPLAQLLCR